MHYELPTTLANCRGEVVEAIVRVLDALDGRAAVGRLRACPEMDNAPVIDELQSVVDIDVQKYADNLKRLSV